MERFILITILLLFIASANSSCTPSQVHIALTGAYATIPTTSSALSIIFQTTDYCPYAYIVLTAGKKEYYLDHKELNPFHATYPSGNYTTYVHIFEIPAVPFEQVYSYMLFAYDNDPMPVGPYQFYLPNPKANGKSNKFIMYGDFDNSTDGQVTRAFLTNLQKTNFTQIQAIIHMGDISYNLEDEAGKRGDKFLSAIEPISSQIPYMISPGNHEKNYNFTNCNMKFKMPNFARTNNHYYSFNLGLVHFVSINFDIALQSADNLQWMAEWLMSDLEIAANNRAQNPWIIVYTHRPLYCTRPNEVDCEINAQRFSVFEDIIDEYKVDLYFSGHVHVYERMFPINHGEVAPFEVSDENDTEYHTIINPTAPIYIVDGQAGHEGVWNEDNKFSPGDIGIVVDDDYSILAVESFNSTNLYIELIHTRTGEVKDWLNLVKDVEYD